MVRSTTTIYDANVVSPKNPWRVTGSMKTGRKNHLCQKYVMNSMDVILAVGKRPFLSYFFLSKNVINLGPLADKI